MEARGIGSLGAAGGAALVTCLTPMVKTALKGAGVDLLQEEVKDIVHKIIAKSTGKHDTKPSEHHAEEHSTSSPNIHAEDADAASHVSSADSKVSDNASAHLDGISHKIDSPLSTEHDAASNVLSGDQLVFPRNASAYGRTTVSWLSKERLNTQAYFVFTAWNVSAGCSVLCFVLEQFMTSHQDSMDLPFTKIHPDPEHEENTGERSSWPRLTDLSKS